MNVIAARVAKEAGTLVILDMGGRDEPLSEDLLKNVDIISPNEVPTRNFDCLDRALAAHQQED